jgi:hypothetical protein
MISVATILQNRGKGERSLTNRPDLSLQTTDVCSGIGNESRLAGCVEMSKSGKLKSHLHTVNIFHIHPQRPT